jgi:hypothetical protein
VINIFRCYLFPPFGVCQTTVVESRLERSYPNLLTSILQLVLKRDGPLSYYPSTTSQESCASSLVSVVHGSSKTGTSSAVSGMI